MTPEAILALSLLVTDARGMRPLKPIPKEGAEAIAASCFDWPVYTHPWISGVEWCVGLLVSHSFRESGWNLSAVGDGGKSHGPFQVQGYGRFATWKDAVRVFRRLLDRASVCETELEMLAAGHCGAGPGRDIARARAREASRVLLLWRLQPQPASMLGESAVGTSSKVAAE